MIFEKLIPPLVGNIGDPLQMVEFLHFGKAQFGGDQNGDVSEQSMVIPLLNEQILEFEVLWGHALLADHQFIQIVKQVISHFNAFMLGPPRLVKSFDGI